MQCAMRVVGQHLYCGKGIEKYAYLVVSLTYTIGVYVIWIGGGVYVKPQVRLLIYVTHNFFNLKL